MVLQSTYLVSLFKIYYFVEYKNQLKMKLVYFYPA
jgi:hypothetical protein